MFGRSGNGYGMSSFSFPSYTVLQFLSLFLPFLTNSYRGRLYLQTSSLHASDRKQAARVGKVINRFIAWPEAGCKSG